MVIQRTWRPQSSTTNNNNNNSDQTNLGSSSFESDDSNTSCQLVSTNISVCNRNVRNFYNISK